MVAKHILVYVYGCLHLLSRWAVRLLVIQALRHPFVIGALRSFFCKNRGTNKAIISTRIQTHSNSIQAKFRTRTRNLQPQTSINKEPRHGTSADVPSLLYQKVFASEGVGIRKSSPPAISGFTQLCVRKHVQRGLTCV